MELCEGLVEIREYSFGYCDHSITKINNPASLRRIGDRAIAGSLRCLIRLQDGIESIGEGAFASCIFTNFRVPPLITAIAEFMLINCRSIFSLELPHNVTEIGYGAFSYCYCLRNVAFPLNADLSNDIFGGGSATEQYDLYQLFGSIAEIIRELQHRFDGLPIHSIVYYLSYHQGVLQNLMDAIELDSTGNQQDCLGMTPLHILTCSSVHDIEVYRVIVRKYPTNLITKDRWGALPLLYAFWGAAPDEIIQFLLESYQLHYPNHNFNWTLMVETMGRCDTPKESIEHLLHVKQLHYPNQPIDWEYLFGKFASPPQFSPTGALNQERMQFLFMCGMAERMETLAFKVWRESIINMICAADYKFSGDNLVTLHRIQEKIVRFEEELPKLKEITTILELALWKMKMNEKSHGTTTHYQKKIKADDLSIRSQYRVACGADVVIGHVLPYLLLSALDDDSDSESFADDNDE
jgi:hypothetical protein